MHTDESSLQWEQSGARDKDSTDNPWSIRPMAFQTRLSKPLTEPFAGHHASLGEFLDRQALILWTRVPSTGRSSAACS